MKRVLWAVLSIAAVLSLAGCCCCLPEADVPFQISERRHTGPTQRETHRVDAQGAERVEVTIRFGGGSLQVAGGDTDLLSAEFAYNLEDLQPVVEYKVQDGRGDLVLRHKVDKIRWDRSVKVRNEWQLEFSDQIPLGMDMAVGASSGTLELGGLRLTRLKLEAGAADMAVRFGAPNPDRLESLDVRSGAARLDLIELGNANMEELRFDGGLGTYTFDFGGAWQRSATARILAGASRVELRVPKDIGVRVCPGDLRRGDYGGLTQSGECFVNDLYDSADVQLDIDLDLGLGQLQVKQINRK